MSVLRLGLGSALLLTLGFAGAAPPFVGDYITLGQGESASRFAMFGLSPGTAPTPPDVNPQPQGGGGYSLQFHIPQNVRLLADDEVFLWVINAAIISGALKG